MTIKGVVLSQKALGEQDKFMDVLTETGIVEILVKGSAKITSKNGSATQLFAYTEFDVTDSSRIQNQKNQKNFCHLRSASPIRIFYGLRQSVQSVTLASYFAQVILYSALPQASTPEILRLLLNCLHYLSGAESDLLQIKCIFELRIVSLLGFRPDVLMCRKCGCYLPERLYFQVENGCFCCESCEKSGILMPAGTLQAIRHIVLQDFEKIFSFRIAPHCRDSLFAFAEQFLQYHTARHFPALEYY
ncbi:MAG: DNA repair protein RecO, partial [Oscillospiraceae bacterium]|nr:DNA repair protein RecO [Oscillospiraceae bacterium]